MGPVTFPDFLVGRVAVLGALQLTASARCRIKAGTGDAFLEGDEGARGVRRTGYLAALQTPRLSCAPTCVVASIAKSIAMEGEVGHRGPCCRRRQSRPRRVLGARLRTRLGRLGFCDPALRGGLCFDARSPREPAVLGTRDAEQASSHGQGQTDQQAATTELARHGRSEAPRSHS